MLICVAGITMAVGMFTRKPSNQFDRLPRLASKEARQAELRAAEVRLAQRLQAAGLPDKPRPECWLNGPHDYFAQTKICSGQRYEGTWLAYSSGDRLSP
jgi:hypothetical protein